MKKKIYFWIALIGFTLVISSCAKKEESDDPATDDSSDTNSCATDTTASGSITVGSETLSGIYISECSTWYAAFAGQGVFPSDTKSGKEAIVVTGDSAISKEFFLYTDSSCSTPSMYLKKGHTSVTIGDASGSNYKVTFNDTTFKMKVSTTVAENHIETVFSSLGWDLTVGSEFSGTNSSNDSYMNVFHVTSTTIKIGAQDKNTQPTELESYVMTKSCQ